MLSSRAQNINIDKNSCFTVLCLFRFPQDIIHKISSPYGNVQRIVIFKKNGVQAMVEYPSKKLDQYFDFRLICQFDVII